MNIEFKTFIDLVLNDKLDLESTMKAFNLIMNGSVSDIQISSFLSILQKSGVRADHIIGAIEVMRSKMVSVAAPENSMDTCGTGGDGKNSLNISTATAFVLASHGIPIAKHGNRALTSKCGSADVLKALGINIGIDTSKLEDCINEIGLCFMFAPNHHPAMKYVGPVRQQLGIRTIFNMLGPLLNPADVKNQLIGVYSKEVFTIYKDIFLKNSNKNACIVSGYNGNDEISLEGENTIFTKLSGEIKFDPATIDIPRPITNEILGKDAKYNANRIIEIFNGKNDSFYRSVCINAAFGLLAHDSRELNDVNILKAYQKASDIMKSGEPLNQINKLIKFTNK